MVHLGTKLFSISRPETNYSLPKYSTYNSSYVEVGSN